MSISIKRGEIFGYPIHEKIPLGDTNIAAGCGNFYCSCIFACPACSRTRISWDIYTRRRSASTIDIYIKPAKKVTISERQGILIEDVAEVVATADVAEKVNVMKLIEIHKDSEKKKSYLVSVTDIIKKIKKTYPEYTVNNVGEMDTLVQYSAQKSQDHTWLKWLRVALVLVVLFVGSATAIMSFHSDGQMPKIFEQYYRMFYGEEKSNPLIVNIPYSIGIAVGIIVFYNHFMGKKITDDPTPIEVEMELYEKDVTETVVEVLNQRKKAREDGVKNAPD